MTTKDMFIRIEINLDAPVNDVTTALFIDRCEQVMARLLKYHNRDDISYKADPKDYEFTDGYGFFATIDVCVNNDDAYDPDNYKADEIRGLLSGTIDYTDTGFYKEYLYDVNFIFEDENITETGRYNERNERTHDDEFTATLYYTMD